MVMNSSKYKIVFYYSSLNPCFCWHNLNAENQRITISNTTGEVICSKGTTFIFDDTNAKLSKPGFLLFNKTLFSLSLIKNIALKLYFYSINLKTPDFCSLIFTIFALGLSNRIIHFAGTAELRALAEFYVVNKLLWNVGGICEQFWVNWGDFEGDHYLRRHFLWFIDEEVFYISSVFYQ
eukprot:snap_masked-scaffold_65-processed-gene-0.3-mRNA-1 protein AED:1.00 eAED:1.00 QI:0/0/0/0/1/1/2/0/178